VTNYIQEYAVPITADKSAKLAKVVVIRQCA